jgi:hypothetical protein
VPSDLSPTARTLLRSVVTDYVLEPWHVRLLVEALRSLDRAEQARRQLKTDGLVTATRLGEVKAHPLLLVERDARNTFARLMKQLGLDLEGPPPPSERKR